jgi:hypothetical protein
MTTARHEMLSLFPDIVANKYSGPLPISVQHGNNADLIRNLRYLYFPGSIVDLTYGTAGGWWKRWHPDRLTISTHDFRALPYADHAYDTVCYDPPYVCSGTVTDASGAFRERYGIDTPRTGEQLEQLVIAGAIEAARVTNRFLLVKCMGAVSGSKWIDLDYRIWRAVTDHGMHLWDEVILGPSTGPGGHNIETPVRTRSAHSKLLVFSWRARP